MMVGPAARAGLEFEEGLPERILDETGNDPGALALLAFALRALYEAKTDRSVLSHAAYDRIGGVRSAIARRAEETYNNLFPEAQDLLMTVFRELVETDERRTATRRWVPRAALPAGEAAESLVDAFTEARLLVTDRSSSGEAVVEVAHEALLREWPRLADWIAVRAEDLRVRRHAESAAAEWQRSGADPSRLWHHELLAPVYGALDRLGVDRTKLAEPLRSFLRPEAERLLEELEKPETSHYHRAEIGDHLDRIGDPRPGVGLRPDGVPDIIWCPVPTEWEWQQAATGGTPENTYPWGSEWDADSANTSESGFGRTTAVRMYPHGTSPVGVSDMVGTVWEWCLNKWYVPHELTYQGMPTFGLEDRSPFGGAAIYGVRKVPTIMSEVQRPVMRGGSWYSLRDYASCAVRDLNSPHDRSNDLGFRLVRNRSKEPPLSENYGRGWEKAEDVELKLKKNPIPFITRYGWKFLAMLVALLVILFVAVAVDQSRPVGFAPSEMVLVPAGAFTMGSTQGEIDTVIAECRRDGVEPASCHGWFQQEFPQRRVFLDAYYIDRFEVTNRSFARFVQASGYRTTAEREGYGYTIGEPDWDRKEGASWQAPAGSGSTAEPMHPVVMMSWHDADAYCRWAGKRLPTEAEWEKAARGTDGRRYPWGDTWDPARANAEMTVRVATAVGSYPQGASPYGVHDMAGNVSEWVQDRYGFYPSGYAVNPTGPQTGADRVLRGGAWTDFREAQRPAHRSHFPPDQRFEAIGFRCAHSAPRS